MTGNVADVSRYGEATTANGLAGRSRSRTRLAEVLAGVAHGAFPAPDGGVEILRQPSERDAGVLAFTGHAVVFADADPGWIGSLIPPDDLSAPVSPRFLAALAERLGRQVHSVDMLTCAHPLAPAGGSAPVALLDGLDELRPGSNGATHPRVARALRYRHEVRAWQADGGVIALGRGIAGRCEVSIEVDPGARNAGLGARLATAARQLAPPGEPLWAQIAPGNAASVRAFLRAGFRPVGAEALLSAHTPG